MIMLYILRLPEAFFFCVKTLLEYKNLEGCCVVWPWARSTGAEHCAAPQPAPLESASTYTVWCIKRSMCASCLHHAKGRCCTVGRINKAIFLSSVATECFCYTIAIKCLSETVGEVLHHPKKL